MLQIVICDDENKIRHSLREVVEREVQLRGLDYQIFEFASGEALTAAPGTSGFDIIFLDIDMKELNGIETAKQIRRSNKTAVIIFVTAYPDFVFQGYDVKALNYILKPYQEHKIIEILHLALAEREALKPLYFPVEQRSGITRLVLQDTLYFFSDKRNITAVTGTMTVTFYGKLDELQKKLPDFFIRIHNRYLVNINYILEVTGTEAVCGGQTLPVSRQYKQSLLIAFAKYMLR